MLQGQSPCQKQLCRGWGFAHVMSTPLRFDASAATLYVVVLNPFAVFSLTYSARAERL